METTLDIEYMRHGQKLDYDQLRQEAADLVKEQRWKRVEIAEKLGVTKSVVSRALNGSGSTWMNTQIKIIELLSNYTVESKMQFTIRRKPNEEG